MLGAPRVLSNATTTTTITPEQQHHKNHVISLRNKIAKLQFEIDDLKPSLIWHEDSLIDTTKPKEDQASEEE